MTAADFNPTAWLAERTRIHDAATEGPWVAHDGIDWVARVGANGYELADTGKHEDAAAIADAHNSLPKALDALGAVLELHHRREWTRMRDFQHFGQVEFPDQCDRCHVKYPCETVAAIQTVLGVES